MISRPLSRRSGKRMSVLAAAVLLVLISCHGGMNMIMKDTKPPLTAKKDRALLVIIRTTSFQAGYVVGNYLDGKMIGQTQFKSYFLTEVRPGKHYVVSQADNKDAVRINFEGGRIYFLQQGMYPGWNATSRYSVMTLDDFKIQVQESTYSVYDTQHPGKDMDAKDYKDATDDFDKLSKEDPPRYKEFTGYRGYTAAK
ncbi:MAG TPA: DUF2846 domain-containing protein [Nitrospirota bacterium]|nr:DUF2846 domain-containing protein [Nitrospirota bacterium]